jgi:hypothetical protein
LRFIPFAEIENAMAVFQNSLKNNNSYKYGSVQLNTRYKYIPFAKVGWDSPDYYMFVYNKENPEDNPAVVIYHTKSSVMYICAVNFQDLMFQHLVWKIKEDRKSDMVNDVVNAYAMFLSKERAKYAINCDYNSLIKMYSDYILTKDGIILEKQMFFPHLISVEEAGDLSEDEIPPSQKLIISKKSQKIVIKYDDIRYIEADNKISTILLEKKHIQCSKSMSYIESLLPEDIFFRCHKSFIIGFKHITSHSERKIVFDNGKEAVVSKRKYSEFKIRYAEYLEM